MPDRSTHKSPDEPLSTAEAERLAVAMSAFTAPSRLRLLYALVDAERSVEDLAKQAGLRPNVVSQQLRVLRQLRAVAVRREGRRAFYRLSDHHMADLLAAIRQHAEHGENLEPKSAPPRIRPRAGTLESHG